jgi:hypothetical protein
MADAPTKRLFRSAYDCECETCADFKRLLGWDILDMKTAVLATTMAGEVRGWARARCTDEGNLECAIFQPCYGRSELLIQAMQILCEYGIMQMGCARVEIKVRQFAHHTSPGGQGLGLAQILRRELLDSHRSKDCDLYVTTRKWFLVQNMAVKAWLGTF